MGAIRCIIETEEDVDLEARMLAHRIHRLLSPGLFPGGPPTPAIQPVDSLRSLGAYPVNQPRRIGAPGPPIEPRPLPPDVPSPISAPASPAPRFRMLASPETTRPTPVVNLVPAPKEPTLSAPGATNHPGPSVTQAPRSSFDTNPNQL